VNIKSKQRSSFKQRLGWTFTLVLLVLGIIGLRAVPFKTVTANDQKVLAAQPSIETSRAD